MSGTKNSIGNVILLTLEKSVDGFVRLEDFIDNTHFYANGYERNLQKSSLAKALKRLRENGLIDFVEDRDLILKLTKKGKERADLVKIKREEQVWDGKWRFVIFDIPEKRRGVRDVFRIQLKQFGFVKRQQSVWISKKNCTQFLKEYIKKVGIQDWVMIIESDNIIN